MADTDTSTSPELRVRLNLPYLRPPAGLAGNSREGRYRKAADTKQVRNDVTVLAKAAGLHRYQPGDVEHFTIQLVWAPGRNGQRDEDNLFGLLKVCADALARGRRDWVGLDLTPNDTSRYCAKPTPLILPPPEPKGMWLDLTLRLARPGDDA